MESAGVSTSRNDLIAATSSGRDKGGEAVGFTELESAAAIGTLAVRNDFALDLDGVAEELVKLWEMSEGQLGGNLSGRRISSS